MLIAPVVLTKSKTSELSEKQERCLWVSKLQGMKEAGWRNLETGEEKERGADCLIERVSQGSYLFLCSPLHCFFSFLIQSEGME